MCLCHPCHPERSHPSPTNNITTTRSCLGQCLDTAYVQHDQRQHTTTKEWLWEIITMHNTTLRCTTVSSCCRPGPARAFQFYTVAIAAPAPAAVAGKDIQECLCSCIHTHPAADPLSSAVPRTCRRLYTHSPTHVKGICHGLYTRPPSNRSAAA